MNCKYFSVMPVWIKNYIFLFFVGIYFIGIGVACTPDKLVFSDRFRLNQIGYYPAEEKIASVAGVVEGTFRVKAINTGKIMYEGPISKPRKSDFSDKQTVILDFSTIATPGEYVLEIKNIGCSYPFAIREHVLQDIGTSSLKAYYYQRSGTPIEKKYAEKWYRTQGHPDTCVYIHPSAVSSSYPEGTAISSPKGWYDAGDYNKYIVNSSYTVGILLALYEDYAYYMNDLSTNIPESENQTPDILDEIYWNIDWMFTMQDSLDGGVYHKLTTPSFEGMVTPEACNQPRYVVQKSITATLGFAAAMAQASRVFAFFGKDYPGVQDRCLFASRKAFKWAEQHPDAYYDQDGNNKKYQPAIITGGYEDGNASDEFFWAASELYVTTGEEEYLTILLSCMPERFICPTWSNVGALGVFSLVRYNQMNNQNAGVYNELKNKILIYVNRQTEGVEQSPYYASYGRSSNDFFWGCNSDGAANQGITFLYAYRLTQDERFLTQAMRNLDYILGRNATGYCYVTGFGTKSPRNPHHRLAAGDGIDDPIPGFLVGGPNPGMQDKCSYPSHIPDEAYIDILPSYASNEIAINWNSTFTYLICGIDASVMNYPGRK